MSKSSIFIGVFLLIWMAAETGLAQNAQTQSSGWQPPTMQYKTPPRVEPTQRDQEWWPPNAMVADPKVRTASAVDFELPEPTIAFEASPDQIENLADEAMSPPATSDATPWSEDLKSRFASVDLQKMFGSLAIVLGAYFGFVWLTRKMGSSGSGRLPKDVLDVVGTAPFGPRKSLQLVRLGSKLLLLIHGPEGTHSVGEVTDPDEVEHLIELCQPRSRPHNAHFRNLMGGIQRTSRLHATQSARSEQKENLYSSATSPANTNPTAELEQIVRRLSNVVDQNNSRNVFEA